MIYSMIFVLWFRVFVLVLSYCGLDVVLVGYLFVLPPTQMEFFYWYLLSISVLYMQTQVT